ncbi:RE1 [Symbiodinium sp. CCMP2592]|nr:RE1 [Symbiodinium sp. CCMP2592]
MENFLLQLRAAHAVPQRKFMDKKNTSSFVLSYGLYAHGSQAGVMNSTFQNPHLCRFINQWLRVWAPTSAHWTTFSIIYNMESKPHRDLHNLKGQPNYVITFGDHEHGELWLERLPDEPQSEDARRRRKPNGSVASGILVSPRHKVVEFTPDRWHATMPWRGTRIALAAYTARSFRDLDPELRRDLLQASFPLPRPLSVVSSIDADVCRDVGESFLADDEKVMILNDYQQFQDLLLENFEVEDTETSLFGLEVCCASPSDLREELQARGEWVQTLGFAEGGDLGTVRGAELVKTTVRDKRPRWLVCHVPLGPERKGMNDDMSSSAWRRFSKVVRHLLEVTQVQIDAGGEVLWCQPMASSARFLSSVRVFWHQHQNHADGRLTRCGDQGFRSTSTALLQSLPCSGTELTGLTKVLAKTMQQVIRNDAVFALIGAVDMSVLDGISAAELGELMERAHRIHSRLGHPSNRLLVKNLQARHADKKLIAAASQLKCDACLESRIKAPRPPVDLSRSDRLWTDLQMDLFQMKIDDRVYHFLLFVDECSGYAVIRLVFDHPSTKGGNATSMQVCHLLEEAWTQYFGYPERIKLDAESALRGTLLRDWCATRGVELLHAPAEHHQFISEVERSIGTLRRKIETFLRERPEHPRQVALAMVLVNFRLYRARALPALIFIKYNDYDSASAYPHYLPGDLVYYRRLKKCHYTQLRPASEAEHLIAQQSGGTTFPWTMSHLTAMLNRGAYEDMTRERAIYPDDLELPGDEPPADDLPEDPGEQLHDGPEPLSEEELIPDDGSSSRKRDAPEPSGEEEMVPDNDLIDLNKLFNDPGYMPFQPIPSSARVAPYPQESFREQRARHEQEDRPLHVKQAAESSLFMETAEADKVFAVTIDAPADAQAWKKMVKHPEKFMSKSVSKGVEISWQRLSAEQRAAMAEAKGLEVAQWVQLKVCKKVAEHVPESQLLRMRWVLTFKEAAPSEAGRPQVKAKARIVILGFSDPGLLEDTTASPTMSKLTRQLMLNLACIKQWSIFSADVRTAFLQARPADRGRRLLAKPLPELAEELGLSPQECVELTGSAYGLATAPKEWFADVSATLKRLGAEQCRTDPCAWIIRGIDGEVAGILASHVDDFLIMGSATDANWLNFLAGFKAAYTWAPWQQGDFVHCGIRLLQHEDWSVTLDHSSFCADLVQMDPASSGTPLNDNQVRQAKAILGSAQWRVTQSAPHHAAKLSMLQSLLPSRDGSCVDQINKLVREIHSSKHIAVQVQHLGQFDPKAATFVAWSDASLANRPDGTSTGGLIIGMMSPKAIEVGQGKVNIISWRSYKLPRVARSSLSAEARALSNCEQELMYARLAWFELNGGKIDVRNPAASTAQAPGHLIIDARGVYDTLMKADPGTILNWCDSDHQLADGLTKSAKQDVLKKFLLQGHWRLRHPGAFMSAKRRRVLDGADRSDPLDVQPVAESTQACLFCAALQSFVDVRRTEKVDLKRMQEMRDVQSGESKLRREALIYAQDKVGACACTIWEDAGSLYAEASFEDWAPRPPLASTAIELPASEGEEQSGSREDTNKETEAADFSKRAPRLSTASTACPLEFDLDEQRGLQEETVDTNNSPEAPTDEPRRLGWNGESEQETAQAPSWMRVFNIVGEFPDTLTSCLSVHSYAALRVTCRDSLDCMHTKELVGHLLRLTEGSWSGPHPEEDVRVSEPERGPMLFMALGSGKETVDGEDFWTRMGGDDHQSRAGIRSFIRGINVWYKAWPESAIRIAERLRCHCSHPHETIAKNAQRTLVFWAGQCFQTAKAKAVRHLLIKDMIYWLRHADDGLRVEICLAFAIRGPHLLGRFREACVQALLEACGPNDACRKAAVKALRAFAETDLEWYLTLRPRLVEVWIAGQQGSACDILHLIGDMDADRSILAMRAAWQSCRDIASSIFEKSKEIFLADPFKACSATRSEYPCT